MGSVWDLGAALLIGPCLRAGISQEWLPRGRRACPCCSWTRPVVGCLNLKRRTTSLKGTLVSLPGGATLCCEVLGACGSPSPPELPPC